jgi:hypothetical protein
MAALKTWDSFKITPFCFKPNHIPRQKQPEQKEETGKHRLHLSKGLLP